MSNKYTTPTFSLSLLHPRYWKTWLGFGSLALIVNILPYAVLFKMGRSLGVLGMKLGKSRVKVARRNLELAFPEMTEQEKDRFVIENFKNTGLALVETGIAWFWPKWRIQRILLDKDLTQIRQLGTEREGVLMCCTHALNLEITARACAVLGLQGFGVYRPHNNPAYDLIQCFGRTRDGNKLIHRKNVKLMMKLLKQGERVFYLPDHDYGRNKSVFVPFFAIDDACTTTGTSLLQYATGCEVVLGSGFRNNDNKYEFIVDKFLRDEYPQNDVTAAAAYMNRHIEEIIMRAPEQWMWLHKRYKTMPESGQKGIRYK